MKYLFFILFSIAVFSSNVYAQKASLVLRVTGLRNNKGKVLFALYKDGKNWLTMQTFRNGVIAIKGSTAEVTFTDLDPGNYGASFYHDENNSQVMDMNFLGVPTESFGFSNINSLVLSKPDYSDCKFILKAGETKVLSMKVLTIF